MGESTEQSMARTTSRVAICALRRAQRRNCPRSTRRMCIDDAALFERLHAAGLETNTGKGKPLFISEKEAVIEQHIQLHVN